MIVVPIFESTPGRRSDAIVNSLRRGLFVETGSRKTFPTERIDVQAGAI
jgi:hypothetical protein